MIRAECPVCKNINSRVIFSWYKPIGSKCYLMNCRNCGLSYKYPVSLMAVHNETYEEDYFKDYQKYYSDFRFNQYGYYMNIFEKDYLKEKGRLLDIGCAFGFFLKAARERGWDVEGFDISAFAKKKSKEISGVDIINAGSLNKAGFLKNSFDLITMWDVLEHDTDPRAMLTDANFLLKPGGHILIKVPNAQELFMYIVRLIYVFSADKFINIGPRFDHHIYLFSRKSFQLILKQSGFNVLDTHMDLENLVIDNRKTYDSFIKSVSKSFIKFIEKLIPPLRSSMIAIAKKPN